MSQREAQANAQILEMVGDIPDADAKPPENVLFVCKLNPATTAEDLEVIFSRFGPIISSEVIKDQKTGDSLQYAFIEFENEEDCTNAYFKMDNVLIDDRRIHVDFCQSLAKVKGVRRRKLSSEKDESLSDRHFVAKSLPKKDGYEMVVEGVGDEDSKPARKKRRWDEEGQGVRERKREESGHRRDRGDRHKGQREREREQEARGRREREKKHRHRSRSRSKERSRHKHRHRSRSRDRH